MTDVFRIRARARHIKERHFGRFIIPARKVVQQNRTTRIYRRNVQIPRGGLRLRASSETRVDADSSGVVRSNSIEPEEVIENGGLINSNWSA